jgi:GDP-L-fucose synthase
MPPKNTPPKIYVAGHLGIVGSAIVRQLLNNSHPQDYLVTGTLEATNEPYVLPSA